MSSIKALFILGSLSLWGQRPPVDRIAFYKSIDLVSVDNRIRLHGNIPVTILPSSHGMWSYHEWGESTVCGCDGGTEFQFSWLSGLALEDAVSEAQAHRLPPGLNIPPWDSGRKSHCIVEGVKGYLIARTNGQFVAGRLCEVLYLLPMDKGLLVIHAVTVDGEPLAELAGKVVATWRQAVDSKTLDPNRVASGPGRAEKGTDCPMDFHEAVGRLDALLDAREKEVVRGWVMGDGAYGDIGIDSKGNYSWFKWLAMHWGFEDRGSPVVKQLCDAGVTSGKESEILALFLGLKQKLKGQKVDLAKAVRELKVWETTP